MFVADPAVTRFVDTKFGGCYTPARHYDVLISTMPGGYEVDLPTPCCGAGYRFGVAGDPGAPAYQSCRACYHSVTGFGETLAEQFRYYGDPTPDETAAWFLDRVADAVHLLAESGLC